MTTAPIEVYADVLCPFAHAAIHLVLDRRPDEADRHRLQVRAWPLELINDEPADPGLVAAEVDRLRETTVPDLFVGFDRGNLPTTALPAFALAAAANRKGPAFGEAVSLELRHRLWDRGEDVSDPDVLAEIAERNELRVSDEDRASIEHDLSEGRARGVEGSPHFFAGGGGVFCPPFSVSIDEGNRVEITPEPERFDTFVATAFG